MLDPAAKSSNLRSYYQNWNNSGEFGAERKLIENNDDSGFVSPPLWRTSPQHRQSNYRNLSPTSRAQAIARGQKELMDMVSKMPEGCYELSLRDIVEQSVSVADPVKEESIGNEETSAVKTEDMHMRREREKKRSNSKKAQMSRSGSIDNGGFLLKMVFPISFGTKKKKPAKVKNNIGNNSMNSSSRMNGSESGRVSPRPLLMDGSAKGAENEWWKKRYEETEESESGGLSSNNGSSKSSGCSSSRSSSRNSTAWHGGGGCWSFIFRKRQKKAEEKQA